MKLSVKELQVFDLLLKNTASVINKSNSNNQPITLNLIISYNSSFWSGDFVTLKGCCIEEKYINSDNYVEPKYMSSSELAKLISEFKYSRYKSIEESSVHLLFYPLIHHIQKANLTDLELNPFLYNATKLGTDIKLPFICLDSDCKYEVISIEVTKA